MKTSKAILKQSESLWSMKLQKESFQRATTTPPLKYGILVLIILSVVFGCTNKKCCIFKIHAHIVSIFLNYLEAVI